MHMAIKDRDAHFTASRAITQSELAPEIRLQCPRCSAKLLSLDCTKCGFGLWNEGGIIHALPPARAEHYAEFICDYERIRAAEGRGSLSEQFYVGFAFPDFSRKKSGPGGIRGRTLCYLGARAF